MHSNVVPLLELIRKTSTDLPEDVRKALLKALEEEQKNTVSEYALKIMQRNIDLAKGKSQPLCQDTGSILFYIKSPIGFDQKAFEEEIKEAVSLATDKGYLRQNSVDSLTGKNSGNNLGPGTPTIYFEQHSHDYLDIRLILKGGGCENVGAQYSLPDTTLGAGRDIKGIQKVILDCVTKAQGRGCSPGILGVIIGGDRSTSYSASKKLFLRTIDDVNPEENLKELEESILKEANETNIGPMGFGGKTTLLGVKLGVLNRLPASFFVTVSYMCWSYRRQGIILNNKSEIEKWLY